MDRVNRIDWAGWRWCVEALACAPGS